MGRRECHSRGPLSRPRSMGGDASSPRPGCYCKVAGPTRSSGSFGPRHLVAQRQSWKGVAMKSYESRGMYFEEFSVGQEIESTARTMTEADIVSFAGLSGDYNPLHTDAEFAKSTPYGQRIAHGMLGLSIASGLAVRTGFIEGTALAFMGVNWKFKSPILIGDTIRVRAKATKARAMSSMGGGMVVFAVSILNQRDERVQQGEWTMLIKGRESS